MALAEGDGLDAAIMTVAADQDGDARPAGADAADDVAQHARHFGAVGGLAGAQEDRHRLAGSGFIDMDGQEAAAVIVRVEQRELLTAMHFILGVVDVEHGAREPGRSCRRTGRSSPPHALERDRAGHFPAADGRLRTQVRPALGQPADRQLERRIMPQRSQSLASG